MTTENYSKFELDDMIALKRRSIPYNYYGTTIAADPGRTLFPYPNFWRGDFESVYPIVDERRSGYRPRTHIYPAMRNESPNKCNLRPPGSLKYFVMSGIYDKDSDKTIIVNGNPEDGAVNVTDPSYFSVTDDGRLIAGNQSLLRISDNGQVTFRA